MLYPQVLPPNIQLTLALIGEELKSCKFFSTLRSVGLDDAFYQTDMCSIILTRLGIYDESNEVLDAYFNLLERHSKDLKETNESLQANAFEFYLALVALKKQHRHAGII